MQVVYKVDEQTHITLLLYLVKKETSLQFSFQERTAKFLSSVEKLWVIFSERKHCKPMT